MLSIVLYSLISVILVSLVSFIGVLALIIKLDNLKKIVLFLVSFSAGALFGDAFLHLLPKASEVNGFTLELGIFLISGILVFFIIEKFIHWRHCHTISKSHIHSFAFMNLISDSVHNFIDGLIIASSYLVSIPLGIATTLAVIFHEIPQEIGDFGVLIHGGFSKFKALFFNFITGVTAIIGTITALILNSYIPNITQFLIPFAAGGFIYIAGADLIPELHKEIKFKNSILQFLFFILGISVMILLLFLE